MSDLGAPDAKSAAAPEAHSVPAEYTSLADRVTELIDALDAHEDPSVAAQVDELLAAFDALHRDALGRLAGLLQHHDLLTHACEDPVVGLAFELYDLHPADEGEPLLRTGFDAPADPSSAPPPALAVPPGLIRLADIQRFPRSVRPQPGAELGEAVSTGALTAPAPHELPDAVASPDPDAWTELHGMVEPAPGTMLASGDGIILVCNIAGSLHALRNRCGESPLPLHFGEIERGRIACPWHRGCTYDPSTGESTSGRRTIVYPLITEAGVILVALGRGASTGPLQPAELRAAPL